MVFIIVITDTLISAYIVHRIAHAILIAINSSNECIWKIHPLKCKTSRTTGRCAL